MVTPSNRDLLPHVSPQLTPYACMYFDFCLITNGFYDCCDWLRCYFGFPFTVIRNVDKTAVYQGMQDHDLYNYFTIN